MSCLGHLREALFRKKKEVDDLDTLQTQDEAEEEKTKMWQKYLKRRKIEPLSTTSRVCCVTIFNVSIEEIGIIKGAVDKFREREQCQVKPKINVQPSS